MKKTEVQPDNRHYGSRQENLDPVVGLEKGKAAFRLG